MTAILGVDCCFFVGVSASACICVLHGCFSVLGTVGVGRYVCGCKCVLVTEILDVDCCFLWVSVCLPIFVCCMFVVLC